MLHTNPLFVRSHDFIGSENAEHDLESDRGLRLRLAGERRRTAGGFVWRSLPYALAEAEAEFPDPTQEQALIWGDLVPQMIVTAVIPRWWNVSPCSSTGWDMHMAYAESLLAESRDERRRGGHRWRRRWTRYASPARVRKVDQLLAARRRVDGAR